MASVTGPDSDNGSELTTLVSGDTPTLPGQEQPSIRALFEAHDDAAYDLAVAQIPRDHRVQVKGIWYVRYEPYRHRRSRRSAWYWAKEQAEELIRTTKGKFLISTRLDKILILQAWMIVEKNYETARSGSVSTVTKSSLQMQIPKINRPTSLSMGSPNTAGKPLVNGSKGRP
jgi:hypothetical protein